MSKPKLLLITARSDEGGGPKQVLQILKHLKCSFDFYVAAPSSQKYSPLFKKESSQFIEIPHRRFSFFSFVQILHTIRTEDIRIIHSHGFGAGIYSRLLSLFSVKVVHTYHGVHFKGDYLSKLKRHIDKLLSKLTKISIAVSRSESQKLRKLSIDSTVLENGLEQEELARVKDTSSQDEFKVIGVISRLDPHKNIMWIIDNYKVIECALGENIQILIAGDGEQYNELVKANQEKPYKDNIQFLGFQETYTFFDMVDALIFPSLGEGLPYSVLEAMSYKIPVIASKVSGHTDLLDEESLFTFDVFNIKKRDILNLVEIYRLRIEEQYTIKKMIVKLAKLYATLL